MGDRPLSLFTCPVWVNRSLEFSRGGVIPTDTTSQDLVIEFR